MLRVFNTYNVKIYSFLGLSILDCEPFKDLFGMVFCCSSFFFLLNRFFTLNNGLLQDIKHIQLYETNVEI